MLPLLLLSLQQRGRWDKSSRGSTYSQGARGPWSSLWAPSGHPKAPNRTPQPPKSTTKPTQSAPKSPKRAQTSTTGRPAAKNHQKSSPKHAPEQRRTMKKQSFPEVFVYFAESPYPMAFGPWPSTFDSRHRALGVQKRVTGS